MAFGGVVKLNGPRVLFDTNVALWPAVGDVLWAVRLCRGHARVNAAGFDRKKIGRVDG